jgi:thioesterase domain-containing protein
MGGPLAYEVARQLTLAGGTVSLLAIGDADVTADLVELQEYVWPGVMRNVLGLDVDPDEYLGLDPHERAAALTRLAIDSGAFPADSDLRTIIRMLEIYDVNAEAMANYRAEPFPVRIVLLRTEDFSSFGDTLGWEPYVDDVVVHKVPSKHSELMSPEKVGTVAEILDHYLRAADERALRGPASVEVGR